jgi:dynein heavy chain
MVEVAESNESKILSQMDSLLDQVPNVIHIGEVKKIMETRSDPDPMKTVLLQELDRYNELLLFLREISLATKGLALIIAAN